jgi:hypothetical protein
MNTKDRIKMAATKVAATKVAMAKDKVSDKQKGIKQNSPVDKKIDASVLAKAMTTGKSGSTKKTGTFKGKSNSLGHGGRAAQLKAKGVPGGVIGAMARKKGAAPGGSNYHGK